MIKAIPTRIAHMNSAGATIMLHKLEDLKLMKRHKKQLHHT